MVNFENPCTRCGRQRIVVKTKKERIAGSWVTTTITTCPDPECQKMLDKEIQKEKVARDRLISLFKNPTEAFGRNKKKNIVLKKT